MRLFDFLRPKSKNKKLIDEKALDGDKDGQMLATTHALSILRNYDVTDTTELKLEYFFYANTADKAEQLANKMKQLGYTVYDEAATEDHKQFGIAGLTTKIKMNDKVVEEWIKQMREIGDKFDCEFDGWGTIPDQE